MENWHLILIANCAIIIAIFRKRKLFLVMVQIFIADLKAIWGRIYWKTDIVDLEAKEQTIFLKYGWAIFVNAIVIFTLILLTYFIVFFLVGF